MMHFPKVSIEYYLIWLGCEHAFSQPFLRGLTYFAVSAQDPVLARQPHSKMSCDCQLVAYVHCPQCKVICHCICLSPPDKRVQMARQQHRHYQNPGAALLDGRAAVTLTSSGAERHSRRLRLALASQPNATLRKADMNNPPCLQACLWHKDTVLDQSFGACVSES